MDNQVDQGFLFPSEFAAGSMQPWPTINSLSPCQFSANYYPVNDYDNSLLASLPPLPPAPSSIYGDCPYPHSGVSSDPLGLSALYMGSSGASSPFGSIHAELISRMSAQEIMDAKAQAASKSHSEAERRRRERINAHLARLRSLLPSTTKTDKASLLAEVIQHVKELKRQTLELAEENPLPTESDELTVDATSNDDGKFVVKASLCCEDRSDLIQDIIKALKALRLRTLKAEITTLGGRVKNILVITGEDENDSNQQLSIETIQDALKAVMERSAADESSHSAGGTKRQRTNNLSSILQQRSL